MSRRERQRVSLSLDGGWDVNGRLVQERSGRGPYGQYQSEVGGRDLSWESRQKMSVETEYVPLNREGSSRSDGDGYGQGMSLKSLSF